MAKMDSRKPGSLALEANPINIHMEEMWAEFLRFLREETGLHKQLASVEDELRPFFEHGFQEFCAEAVRRIEEGLPPMSRLDPAGVDAAAAARWARVARENNLPNTTDEASRETRDLCMSVFVHGFRAGLTMNVIDDISGHKSSSSPK